MANWRNKVDQTLKGHLEAQINNSARHRAYLEAPNPGNAQLWIAIANLSRKVYEIQMKLDSINNALKESVEIRKKEEKRNEMPHSEILQIRTETPKKKIIKKKASKKRKRQDG